MFFLHKLCHFLKSQLHRDVSVQLGNTRRDSVFLKQKQKHDLAYHSFKVFYFLQLRFLKGLYTYFHVTLLKEGLFQAGKPV